MVRPGSGLGDWLRGLGEAELIALIGRRPDVITTREPRSLAELADRLSTPWSVRLALEHADKSMLQLIEVLQALGDGVTVEQVERTIGMPGTVPAERLRRVLDSLAELALGWPSGDGRCLRLAGPLREYAESPLALGRPVAELLPSLSVDQLATIAAGYDERAQRRKAAWIELLVGILTDADGVRARLASLPSSLTELAEEIAKRGPYVHGSISSALAGHNGYRHSEAAQLVRLGWVLPDGWDMGQMPREVALAIRGPDYHPPLDADPPPLATVTVHSGHIEVASRAAALSAVEGMRRLVDLLGRAPLATVQAGGVGARELAKASKALGAKEAELRLWLEVLAGAGLATIHRAKALPTAVADDWLASDPADALVAVLRAWWRLDRLPVHYRDDDGKSQPALGYGTVVPFAPHLRADLLSVLDGLEPGTAICDLDALVDQLCWRRPLLYGAPEAAALLVMAAWTECQQLGLVAERAITRLGRALLAGPDDGAALRAVAADLLPVPATTATFLPDLTALVSGTPSAELATLLDSAADSETRDAASTWRFSPASVRRAFDTGRTADELLTALASVADRPLPQPLSYLVRDVARRHGQLRVTPVACCVVADDPALAAEIASHRKLSPLGLRLLGDTVLASDKPADDTLKALRTAGYAPVRQDAGGQTVVERTERRRAPTSKRPTSAGTAPSDLAAIVRRLRSGPAKLAAPTKVHRDLAPHAAQLSDAEQRLLAQAIERHQPILIEYVSGTGSRTARVIEPDTLLPPLLVAWCQLRDAERHFLLDRIAAVAPAL